MFSSGTNLVKLRSRTKGLPRDIGWHLGAGRSFVNRAVGSRILVYHGICQQDPLYYNTLFVKLRTFESQLRLYKKYFNLISLDDYYAQRFSDQKFNICLTFDDGFANNYKYVLPLLEQYRVPASFFVTGIREAGYDILWNDVLCMAYRYGPEKFLLREELFIRGNDRRYLSSETGKKLADILRETEFIDKSAMMELLDQFKKKAPGDYWKQMTAEQIGLLSSSKWVSIGSHGYYHNDLAKISVSTLKEELTRSKQFLENITGKEIKAIAFPYGSYSGTAVAEAKAAGYSQLLATEFISEEDSHDVCFRERLTINPFISNINQLHANITGKYQ